MNDPASHIRSELEPSDAPFRQVAESHNDEMLIEPEWYGGDRIERPPESYSR